MNKVFLTLFVFFVFSSTSFSVDFQLKIIEKKGIINVKTKSGEWKSLDDTTAIQPQTDIFTDFHSQLTFEVGPGSYITVNQLSQIKIGEQKTNINDVITDIYLTNGFIIVYANKTKSYRNRIRINFNNGYSIFEKSGGEVYQRDKQGTIVKSFQGMIKIYPKIKTFYYITKNEICGITPSGILIENDYFLRRNINTIPNDTTNPGLIETYFNFIFLPYTRDKSGSDYKDVLQP
jgi:hypothetical protein